MLTKLNNLFKYRICVFLYKKSINNLKNTRILIVILKKRYVNYYAAEIINL